MSTTILKDDQTSSHDEHANDKAAGHHQSVLIKLAGGWQKVLQSNYDHHSTNQAKYEAIGKGTKDIF